MAVRRGAVKINRPRNSFKMNHDLGTTFDGGLVIPLQWYEILPGDTAEVRVSYVIRQLAQLVPVMSNAWVRIDAYFIPYEVIWDKTRQFFGEQDPATWSLDTYVIPYFGGVSSGLGSVSEQDIGDYMGLPAGLLTTAHSVSALPLRAYIKTWNYWYRDENLYSEKLFPNDGGTAAETYASYSVHYDDACLPAMKLPDYFTTCLPFTSKITPVELNPKAAVITGDNRTITNQLPLEGTAVQLGGANVGPGTRASTPNYDGGAISATTSTTQSYYFTPTNLWAQNASLTIETLRRAIVCQHVGEILARGGSRYASEFLKNIFGVENSESLLDQPEYLGGFEKMINMQEVYSQADTGSSGRAIGDNGAMSKTIGKDYLFQRSFSRHGICLINLVVRHEECYSQGIHRKFTKSSFWDFYLPQAQGLGFQKVLKEELYAPAHTGSGNPIFGYQDYGAEYRFEPSKLTGYMRPYLLGALKEWTWSQVYSAVPTLNSTFMEADNSGFARSQAVSGVAQFFGNFHFEGKWTRVVGVQRFPGLTRI